MRLGSFFRSTQSSGVGRGRWGRRVGYAIAIVLVLGIVACAAAVAWLTEARLTALVNDAAQRAIPAAPIHIGAVHLDDLHTLVVRDVRIGPPKGFHEDILTLASFRVRWHWWPLLHRELRVEEITAAGLVTHFEQTDAGTNLATAFPPSESKASGGFSPPELPVHIVLHSARVHMDAAHVTTPTQHIELTDLSASAAVDARTEALTAQVTFALGNEATGQPSTLTVHVAGEPQLTVKQRARLTVETSDWARGTLTLQQTGEATLKSLRSQTTPTHGDVRAVFDLADGSVDLQRCTTAVGDVASMDAALQLHSLWTAPQLRVSTLRADANLGDAAPFARPWLPDLRLHGQVHLALAPLEMALEAAAARAAAVEATLNLQDIAIATGGVGVTGVNGAAVASHRDETLTVAGAMAVGGLQDGAALNVRHVQGTLWTALPTSGGMLDANAPVTVSIQTALGSATTAQAVLTNGLLRSFAQGPLGWFQGVQGSDALKADTWFTWASASANGARADTGKVHAVTTLGSKDGRHVSADITADIGRTTLANANAAAWQLPAMHATTRLRSDGDAVNLDLATFAVGDLLLKANGEVTRAFSETPHVAADVTLEEAPLLGLAKLAPPPRMDADVRRGTARASMTLKGDVPYVTLVEHLTPPDVSRLDPDNEDTWQSALHSYAAWARGWAKRFDAGLPFIWENTFELRDVTYETSAMSVAGLALKTRFGLALNGPYFETHVEVPEAPAPTPTPVRGVIGDVSMTYAQGAFTTGAKWRIDSAALASEPTPLEGIALDFNARYVVDADAHIDAFDLSVQNRGMHLHGDGVVEDVLSVVAARAWQHAGLKGMRAATRWQLDLKNPQERVLSQTGLKISGNLTVAGEIAIARGLITCAGDLRFDDFSAGMSDQSISHMTGELPAKVVLRAGTSDDALVIARGLTWGGGVLSLVSDADDIRNRPARPIYYDRLRPYRQGHGVRAAHAQSGPYEMTDIALEGRIENGMLVADWLGMNILGGDVAGNFALQLGRDASVRGDMVFKASDIDASYFPALHLNPGPESQMSADVRWGFMFGDGRRDVTTNVNLTKIGAVALDRILQMLDPQKKDKNIQDYRTYLWLIGSIRNVAVWVRFENLNMDLEYDPRLRIPGTSVGYRPIERELVRRFALSGILDTYQPMVNSAVGPLLGWKHAS